MHSGVLQTVVASRLAPACLGQMHSAEHAKASARHLLPSLVGYGSSLDHVHFQAIYAFTHSASMQILDPADPRDILWLYTTTLLPPTPPPVQQLLHHAGKLSKDRQAQILGPVTERSKWQDLLTAQLHEAYNITPRMQSLLLRMHPDAAAAARQVHRLLASTLCDTSAAQYEPDQARQAAAPSGTVNQHSTKGGTTRGGTTKGSEPDISPFEDMVLKAGTRRLQGMTHGSGPSRVKWKSVDDLYRCR